MILIFAGRPFSAQVQSVQPPLPAAMVFPHEVTFPTSGLLPAYRAAFTWPGKAFFAFDGTGVTLALIFSPTASVILSVPSGSF